MVVVAAATATADAKDESAAVVAADEVMPASSIPSPAGDADAALADLRPLPLLLPAPPTDLRLVDFSFESLPPASLAPSAFRFLAAASEVTPADTGAAVATAAAAGLPGRELMNADKPACCWGAGTNPTCIADAGIALDIRAEAAALATDEGEACSAAGDSRLDMTSVTEAPLACPRAVAAADDDEDEDEEEEAADEERAASGGTAARGGDVNEGGADAAMTAADEDAAANGPRLPPPLRLPLISSNGLKPTVCG